LVTADVLSFNLFNEQTPVEIALEQMTARLAPGHEGAQEDEASWLPETSAQEWTEF
jgi:hypothetical protein